MLLKVKKILPKSFLWRTLLLTFIPLLIAQLLIIQFFYERHWVSIGEQLASNLSNEVVLFLNDYDKTLSNKRDELFEKYKNALGFYISTNASNIEFQDIKDKKKFQTIYLREITKKKIKYPTLVELQKNSKRLNIYINHPSGLIKITTLLSRVYLSTIHLFLAWVIGTFLFVLLFITPFIRSQVKSIAKLSQAAEDFGKGKDINYSPTGATEIRKAGINFILMKSRISRFIQGRQEMLSAVSHDIRTPLTRMKLSIETLKDNKLKNDLSDDIKDIELMINSYLQFARNEIKEDIKKVNLYDLIKEAIKDSISNGKKIKVSKFQKTFIDVRENEMRRALINIINNAARYSRKNILISTQTSKNSITIDIEDDGQGIPKEQLIEALKPFKRLDASRNQNAGGNVGLGLTITKNIIESHGGKIKLDNSKLGGLSVKLTLPK